MGAFRYLSLASIGCLMYIAILLFIEMPDRLDHSLNINKEKAEIVPAYFNLDIFSGASMTFFAFQC